MIAKTNVLEQLGETALILPGLINQALAANDRIKYFLTVLQCAREHAQHPDRPVPALQPEREACGVDDTSLDVVAAESTCQSDNLLLVPQSTKIHAWIVDDLRQMLKPVEASAPNRKALIDDRWRERLERLLVSLPAPEADRVSVDYVEAVTRVDRAVGDDSVHLLLMDLHRELNRLQAQIAEEVIDGATVYGIADGDRALVSAFMAGVNATAPLKFEHPGLGTTATRAGERLVIQNDIGTTDAHVLVIHVVGLTLSVMYSDIHPERLRFFQSLLEPLNLEWTDRLVVAAPGAELCVGRVTSADARELADRLENLGSRVVFLIDWNRARKRLGRILKKADAIAVLKWAADRAVGHRAFLQLGDVALVYTAMERAAPAQIRYGARLDEILGRESAQTFLQAVLTISTDGLRQRKSARLVQDEIQAELLRHFESHEQRALNLAADHAMLIVGLAGLVRDALARAGDGLEANLSRYAERAKTWESHADDIVSQSRTLLGQAPATGGLSLLLAEADDVADGLEESAFLLTLTPNERITRKGLAALGELTTLLVRGSQEYLRCLVCAQDAQRVGSREEVQDFLAAVDGVIAFEHASDACERTVQAELVETCSDFRELHVLFQLTERLGDAADALARSALILRDYILSALKTIQ